MKIEHRNEFGNLLTHYDLNGKGVEIGTFKGEFAKTILSNWNGTLYMVDPWRGLDENYIDSSNHYNHNNVYSECMDNLRGFEDRSFMLRGLSNQLVDLFEDNSLDFVYIDGNHAYDFVKEDIELWYPKVKKGGMISGHDYILFNGTKEAWYQDPNWTENKKDKHLWSDNNYYWGLFGVNSAVDEFVKKYGYEVNHTNEFASSWYFIK